MHSIKPTPTLLISILCLVLILACEDAGRCDGPEGAIFQGPTIAGSHSGYSFESVILDTIKIPIVFVDPEPVKSVELYFYREYVDDTKATSWRSDIHDEEFRSISPLDTIWFACPMPDTLTPTPGVTSFGRVWDVISLKADYNCGNVTTTFNVRLLAE
ncbi:MAG: hypothetical protein JXQ90_18225 [Cyclobacteriaceae bacterium]